MTGPRESQYGPMVDAAADAAGIPRDALRAIVWVESGWDPNAYLAEQDGDGSYGLTQVTLSTARGMGFSGDPAGLFDPQTNANYGARVFAGALKNAEQANPGADPVTLLQMAASAYNGGFRPSIGFGVPVDTATTVCLRSDPTTGQCLSSFTAQPGEYGNQGYVDSFTAYFENEGGDVSGLGVEQLQPVVVDGMPGGVAGISLGVASWLAIAAVLGVGYMAFKRIQAE